MTVLAPEEISFYVPARNAGESLEACLRAITNQTLTPGEIIVVVDTASDDNTFEVARSFRGVRLIEHENGKLGWVRNLAIAEATNDWLACSDADVIIDEDWLESLAAHASSGAAVIGGRVEERIRTPFDQWRAVNCPHNWGTVAFRNPYMLVGNALYDRRALLSVGGYQDDLGPYDDSDLCIRLRDAGFDLAYEPAAQAWHNRTDSLDSVLAMRWNYCRFRQDRAFQRLTGLIEKSRLNREFALHSLGKVLALSEESLSYVSFLLFYHHALFDLRELMRRRPLVPASERHICEQQLLGSMLASLGQVDDRLANLVAGDLTGALPEPDGVGHLLYSPPRWKDYLESMERASAEFADALCHDVRALIERSGEFLHHRARAEQVPFLTSREPAKIQATLDRLPAQPRLNAEIARRWRDLLDGTSEITIVGPVSEPDREILGRFFALKQQRSLAEVNGSLTGTVIVLHLEADAAPLERFDHLARQADRMIVSYALPELFIPTLEPLQSRDLASASARAGLEILAFDTFVGATTLVLRRPTAAPVKAQPEMVSAAPV